MLLGLAVISAREGASNDAGRLVGAATAVRSTRAPVDRLEQRLEAAARAAALEACGGDAWEESIAAGLRLDPRERIELGLRSSRL